MVKTSDRDSGAEDHERSHPNVSRMPVTSVLSDDAGAPNARVLDIAALRAADEAVRDSEVYAGFGNVP
jgi:hypothetical protein